MTAFNYSWLQPQRIILVKVTGDLSMEDLTASNGDILQLLDTGQSPVHIVTDIHDMGKFPSNLPRIQQLARPVMAHPSLGIYIVVGIENIIQRFLISVIGQVSNHRVSQTATIEEALTYLKKNDPTLR